MGTEFDGDLRAKRRCILSFAKTPSVGTEQAIACEPPGLKMRTAPAVYVTHISPTK